MGEFELVDWKSFGYKLVAGVDEVGRGCLAGPVYSGAVILGPDFKLDGVTDSKLLTPKVRSDLASQIKEKALCWAIGRCEVLEIDKINILKASLVSMKRAVENLKIKPQHVLVDGRHVIDLLNISQTTIIKGDLRCTPISCASIIAKVARDEFMEKLEEQFPGYELKVHKGYATAKHRALIQQLGPSEIHRKSFSGVKEYLK
ncbi:MAG: ribonuclease HII [Oligoflexia bacterium]|nr:ribonuclease HII [Oligoflexia bacterium]